MTRVTPFPTIDLRRTGRRIERLRRERGLSVRDLQAYFGFEYPQAIYKWQWGECLPSVDNLYALATLLGVQMQDLLVGTDQEVFDIYRASSSAAGMSASRQARQASMASPRGKGPNRWVWVSRR